MRPLGLIIMVAVILFVNQPKSAILYVPSDYPTVQRGLNAASEHDTVLVADGTYYENLKFPPINLVLASLFIMDNDSSHIALTILDGSQYTNQDSASVIFMNRGQDTSTVISGFTIMNGRGTSKLFYGNSLLHGGGCFIHNAWPKIVFNHFCSDSADLGGAIYIGAIGYAVIYHNEFSQNYALIWGGAVKIDSCSAIISDNHVYENYAWHRAGISAERGQEIIIVNNYIHHNSGITTLPITLGFFDTVIIHNNTISDNLCADNAIGGAGASVERSYAEITDNQFLGNIGGMAHGALNLGLGSYGVVSGNVFENNSSTVNGGAISMYHSDFVISNNQFYYNYAVWGGGAIFVSQYAQANIQENTFTGNGSDQPNGSAVASIFPSQCMMRDNNIYGNSSPAVATDLETPYNSSIDALYNWWGDPSGPYHPTLNPNGLGDAVGDSVYFDPWLTDPVWANPFLPPAKMPQTLALMPPYPNPFNPTTTLTFTLPVAGMVKIEVFDINGRTVGARHAVPLHNAGQWYPLGTHSVLFDGSGLSSGVYLARLSAGDFTQTQKLVLLK